MFSNIIAYRVAPGFDFDRAEESLQKNIFLECGATQEKSSGWVPARGEANGPLIESVGGQWIAKFFIESKAVPASVLARRVKEKAALIEQQTGRKPGKRESKELKEEANLDLLPMAFTKQASVWVWIDREHRLIAIDTGSQGRADEVITSLVENLPGLSVSLLGTERSPQAAMAQWLVDQEAPAGFSVDRECELKSLDESKSVVRYGRHPLDIAEVRQHIEQGKLPTRLALTWDGRVSFVLTDGAQIKKVSFLDTVFEGAASKDDGFDADVAIATGELQRLIPDLLNALGGESGAAVEAVE